MTEKVTGGAGTKEDNNLKKMGVRRGGEVNVKEDREFGFKQHYMRVNVDLIKGVLEEVIVNIVEKKKGEEEDEERRKSRSKEDRWLRKWYKRMG